MPTDSKFPPLLIMLSGTSGAGKDSVLNALLRADDQFRFVSTYTSRPPRADEQDGKDYNFISRADFEQMISKNQLLEWAEVYGNLYGVPKAPLRTALADGRHTIIRVDVQGVLKIRQMIPSALVVVVLVQSVATLRARLIGRGGLTPTDLDNRLRTALGEIQALYALPQRYLVFNYENRLAEAVSDIKFAVKQAVQTTPSDELRSAYNEIVKALKD